tara:strand:+ start:199 stop:405 length:207 start_codon:yes stop_codon:yes gene_type:complete
MPELFLKNKVPDFTVPHAVPVYLIAPEFPSGRRKTEQMAVMTMPVTAVHEDGYTTTGENEVRLPRQNR